MSRWFRMYDDVLDDPKVQRLDPHLFKVWVNLLCLASRNDGRIPCADDAAFSLRTSVDDVQDAINSLIDKGLIDVVDDEPKPHNWDKRQFKSDRDESAAKRQAEKRARDNGSCHGHVTRDVTDMSQPTDTDTDTEAEKKIDVVSASAETSVSVNSKPKSKPKTTKPGYTPEFETFWTGFPAREGTSKAEAWVEWVRLPPDDQNAATGALSAFSAWVKKQGPDYRCVHACRYLKHRRWEGFAISATTPAAQQVPVLEGSPAFRAWERARGKSIPVTDLKDPATGRVLGRGWWFETEYPTERVAA